MSNYKTDIEIAREANKKPILDIASNRLDLKKDDLIKVSEQINKTLNQNYRTEVDITQSIGKRYRRQDEIGTPYCITVDFDSLEDNCITVRNRDTMKQDRISIEKVSEYFEKL